MDDILDTIQYNIWILTKEFPSIWKIFILRKTMIREFVRFFFYFDIFIQLLFLFLLLHCLFYFLFLFLFLFILFCLFYFLFNFILFNFNFTLFNFIYFILYLIRKNLTPWTNRYNEVNYWMILDICLTILSQTSYYCWWKSWCDTEWYNTLIWPKNFPFIREVFIKKSNGNLPGTFIFDILLNIF